MWFLNYCSPFLYNPGSTFINRMIMYSEVTALFILYAIFLLLYRIASQERRELPQYQKQDEETLNMGLKLRFAPDDCWVSEKQFKEWYLSHYGMHAVSVGICIMYSPYTSTMVLVLIHFGVFFAATVLSHFRKTKSKAINIFYIVMMVLACLLNIMFLFSGSMGVGASGFDNNAKICLLQSGYEDEL